MNICIFETEHFEGAYPVIKLFDNGKNTITIITTNETKSRFDDILKSDARKYTWAIIDKRSNKFSYFLRLRSLIKNARPDILYLNTVNDNHLLYAFCIPAAKKARVILTIHDINCLFFQRAGINIKSFIRFYGKKQLRANVNELNVVSDTMMPYLLELVKGRKKIHNIPGAVFEKNNNSMPEFSTPLKIVIPGSIDKKRRDYDQLFKLESLLRKEEITLEIILLGGASDLYGNEVIKKAKSVSSDYVKITSFDASIVSQDIFDKFLDECHFIWIPSVINTSICGKIPEVYGMTKSSGNVFDIIKHAKPFIIPGKLKVPEEIESSGFRYDDLLEIVQFLKKVQAETRVYISLQEAALGNSLKFTIQRVREKNKDLFVN